MLDRWTRIQNQPGSSDGNYDGLFSEYSPTNWSLAPTSFGIMHAAEAMDLIIGSGLPFDSQILENARVSLRRALVALFTRADMRNGAREWSNQFNGAYHAALLYLENWPDPELDALFVKAVNDSADQDSSPAGFFYEWGGPDFGYSSVHERNTKVALPRLRLRTDLLPVILEDDREWNEWLAANYVLQPGSGPRTLMANAGLNTRTTHAVLTPESRPLSEWVSSSRIFSVTENEYNLSLVKRRAEVEAVFGRLGSLAVPSGFSYIPSFVFGAVRPLDTWHPTDTQRRAAEFSLGSFAQGSVNRQFHDPGPPRKVTSTTVQRAGYYSVITTGRPRREEVQNYGIGLLWNLNFGIALQSLSNIHPDNPWNWGTRRSGDNRTHETRDITGTALVNGSLITPAAGVHNLPPGEVTIQYPLSGYGQKTVRFTETSIEVTVSHAGDFTELLPLAHASDAAVESMETGLVLRRPNGSSFHLEILTSGATVLTGGTNNLTSGIVRRAVSISASDSLTYRMTFSDTHPSPVLAVPDLAATTPGTPVRVDVLANDSAASDHSLHVTGISFAESTVVPALVHGVAVLDAARSSGFPVQVINARASGASPPESFSPLSGFTVLNDWRDANHSFTAKGRPAPGIVHYQLRSGPERTAIRFQINANSSSNESAGERTESPALSASPGGALLLGAVSENFGEVTMTVGTYTVVSQNPSILGFQTGEPSSGHPMATRALGFILTGVFTNRTFTAEFRGIHGQILSAQSATGVSPNSRLFFGHDSGQRAEQWIHSVVLRGNNGGFNVGLDDFGFTPPGPVFSGDRGALRIVSGLPEFTPPGESLGAFAFTYTVSDGLSNADGVVIVNVGAPSSFEAFLDLYFTPVQRKDPKISGELADPDGDQISNLLEYALASNPFSFEESPLLETIFVDGEFRLQFSRSRFAADLRFSLEESTNLQIWTQLATADNQGPWQVAGQNISVQESKATSSRYDVIVSGSSHPGPPSFLRLKVNR